jgi:hypothetical protein
MTGGVSRVKHKKLPTPKQKIAHISVRNRIFKYCLCGIANLVAAESHCQKSGGWGSCFGWGILLVKLLTEPIKYYYLLTSYTIFR